MNESDEENPILVEAMAALQKRVHDLEEANGSFRRESALLRLQLNSMTHDQTNKEEKMLYEADDTLMMLESASEALKDLRQLKRENRVLKNAKEDKAGKIDLLAYDGETLRILELKEPDSEENMLRCVLEGYTYLKTVDSKKLLADFSLPADTVVEACPFVFRGGFQWEEMQQERSCLKRLMKALDSKPYYVAEENGKYVVMEE